jgi:DNA-binding MarR family transcriptional regulator
MNSERSISLGKMGVLSRLANDGADTASTLSTVLHISPQAITIVVRELEALGLVSRVPDAADRRRIWVDITDAGRARLAFERGAGSGWLDEAVSENLSAEERTTLAAALPVLRKLGASAPVRSTEDSE